MSGRRGNRGGKRGSGSEMNPSDSGPKDSKPKRNKCGACGGTPSWDKYWKWENNPQTQVTDYEAELAELKARVQQQQQDLLQQQPSEASDSQGSLENSSKDFLGDVSEDYIDSSNPGVWLQQVAKEAYEAAKVEDAFPVYVEIRHDGFWVSTGSGEHFTTDDENYQKKEGEIGGNCVWLKSSCVLSIHKKAMIHMLSCMGLFRSGDLDPQNTVPHVMVRKPGKRNTHHKSFEEWGIDGQWVKIGEDSFTGRDDCVMVTLDAAKKIHMTLIYRTGLKRDTNPIDVYKWVLRILTAFPKLLDEYEKLELDGNVIDYWNNTPREYPNNVGLPQAYEPPKRQQIQLPAHINASGTVGTVGTTGST